jgi:hypothetical protein
MDAVIRPQNLELARQFLKEATKPEVTQDEFSRLYGEALRAPGQSFVFIGRTRNGKDVLDHEGVKIGEVTAIDFMVDYERLRAAWLATRDR